MKYDELRKPQNKVDKWDFVNVLLWYFPKKSFLLKRQVELAEFLLHSLTTHMILHLTCSFALPVGLGDRGFFFFYRFRTEFS